MKPLVYMSNEWMNLYLHKKQLLDEGKEVPPELDKQIDEYETLIPEKIDNYFAAIEMHKAAQQVYKDQIEANQAQIKYHEELIEKLKKNLANSLRLLNVTSLRAPSGRLIFLQDHLSVDFKAKDVPDEYKKDQVSRVPDKDKIKKDLMEGLALEFARLDDTPIVKFR